MLQHCFIIPNVEFNKMSNFFFHKAYRYTFGGGNRRIKCVWNHVEYQTAQSIKIVYSK